MGAGKLAIAAGGALLTISLIASAIAGEVDYVVQPDTFAALLASAASGDLKSPPKFERDSFAGFDAIDSAELGGTKATELTAGGHSVLVRAIPVRIGPQNAVIYLRKDTVPVPDDEVDALLEVETTVASGKKVAVLTEQGINSMIVGNSLTGFSRGARWTEYYAPDGAIRGNWRNSRYLAKWSVNDREMCFDYAEQAKYCLIYSVVGEQVFFYQSDGSGGQRTFRLLPGNPLGL